jgi:hypothetical protein
LEARKLLLLVQVVQEAPPLVPQGQTETHQFLDLLQVAQVLVEVLQQVTAETRDLRKAFRALYLMSRVAEAAAQMQMQVPQMAEMV